MSDTNYRPTGNLEGDSKAMPDRGTGTGVTDTYGADLSLTARNRKGSITGATQSNEALENCPCNSTTI